MRDDPPPWVHRPSCLAPNSIRRRNSRCGAAGRGAWSGAAQVGTTTDILTGTVTDPLGHPIEGADIEAMSMETEITRHTHTNDKGRYTIVFPNGGGQYRITIRFIGMAPSVTTVRAPSRRGSVGG